MKKLSLCLSIALLAFTQLVHAESKLYGPTDPGTPFPDKSTIETNGTHARMVVLYAYKRMKSGTIYHSGKNERYYYRSTKVLFEFDCAEKRSRILQTVFFSDKEGKGNLVHDQPSAGDWSSDTDAKNSNSIFSMACTAAAKP